MINPASTRAKAGREDVSNFIVHLTRKDGDTSAKSKFIEIINSGKIQAIRPNCLFNKDLKSFTEEEKSKFNVSCFTEVPLHQIHLLTGEIPGRQVPLEPYGFVFKKSFLLASGGQPAIYINGYESSGEIRNAVFNLFNTFKESGKFTGEIWKLLPFINIMYEKVDFSWEREWRVRGDLCFKWEEDLVCVILPSEDEKKLKEAFVRIGIPFICPGYTYEQVVTILVAQQRIAKKLWQSEKQVHNLSSG